MSKEEALKYWEWTYENIKYYFDPHWEESEHREHREHVQAVEWAIKALKEADAYNKNKEGKWVIDKVYYSGNGKLSGFTAKCSECGFTYKTNYSDYCPGCGAKMKIDKWWER